MAWSPDGKSIAVVAHSFFTKSITPVQTFISLMNVGSGRLEGQETLQEPHTFRPCFFSFHPDGKTIALACPDALSLWSVPSLERITSFSPPTMPGWNTAAPHRPVGAKAIAFSPNGDTLAVIDTAYRSLLLDAKTGACRHILPSPKQHRPTVAVYSPDNSLLAVCNTCVDRQYRHTLQIWETTTNRLLRIMSPHETEVNAVAFSRTGRLVATAGHDSLVRIWSVASGKQVAELQGHAWPVLSLDFSPDGRKLVSGSADGTALLWDLKGIEPSLPAADPARLATYWKTLIDRDPSSAYTAMLSLVALGDKAVAYLRARLQPVAPLDPRRFRQLLADLDSDEFTTREAASRELTRCARVAEMPLKNALARGPSEEARKRIESILATLPTTEELQQQRAVVALEQIGSTDALRLLQSLAAGADSHPLTRAARPALRRLQRGKTAP